MDAITSSLGEIWMKTAGVKSGHRVNGTKKYCILTPMHNGFIIAKGVLEPRRHIKSTTILKHHKPRIRDSIFEVYTYERFKSYPPTAKQIHADMLAMVETITNEGVYFYSKDITLAKRYGRFRPSAPIESRSN